MERGKALRLSLLLVWLSIFLFSRAFADEGVYVEQEIQTMRDEQIESSEQVKLWIAGDYIRIDSSVKPNYTVIDLKRSVMFVIDLENKVYMEFPVDTSKSDSSRPQEFEVSQEFKRTGNVKKIGRWECFEVEVMTEIKDLKRKESVKLRAGRTFLWLTKSKELEDERLKSALWRSLFGLGVSELDFDRGLKDKSQVLLDGLPVQKVVVFEIESIGKRSIRQIITTIKDIKVLEIPTSIFQIPSGYRKLSKD